MDMSSFHIQSNNVENMPILKIIQQREKNVQSPDKAYHDLHKIITHSKFFFKRYNYTYEHVYFLKEISQINSIVSLWGL